MQLRPFQKEFSRAVENDLYDTVVLSGPRSLGKTFMAAHNLTRCLTPGDVLHQPGKEYILGAVSMEQARLTYGFIREWLGRWEREVPLPRQCYTAWHHSCSQQHGTAGHKLERGNVIWIGERTACGESPRSTGEAGMNTRQSLFIGYYVASLNATQSALDAGYSPKTAYSQGQRLLKKC